MGNEWNAINSTDEKKPSSFPLPSLVDTSPHLLRSVTAGFSQSLAWLGWEAPSLPEAVGGSGREDIWLRRDRHSRRTTTAEELLDEKKRRLSWPLASTGEDGRVSHAT